MTAFFGVYLVLVIVSLTLGTIIGLLGIRALRAVRRDAPARSIDQAVAANERV